MIPIFLSRPNPFLIEQEQFLETLGNLLHTKDFENMTLVAQDYNPYESLSCLSEQIKRCYGMIIVAFGQSYIEKGTAKKGAISIPNFFNAQERSLDNMWITSPFCQIEGTFAFSNKLPLLILEQEGLKIEGILENGTHAIKCPPFSLDYTHTSIAQYFSNEQFLSAFFQWEVTVKQLYDFVQKQKI